MNVVIYARYSSDKQTEQSIEGQLRVCHEYAQKNGYTVINEYIDRAMTGRNDDRPDFQRMIEDSKKKNFEAVLVYQLDRFARNREDSAMNKHKLKKNGVRVISARENVNSGDASDIILESVLEGMAEYFSKELSQKVKRGMRLMAEKCQYTGSQITFGYKVVDKNYVIDEEKASIVKQIFSMYAQGSTIIEIVKYLNERHLKTGYNKPFGKNSLNHILANKKYIGVYHYGDIEIKDGIPRIIDDELFNKVQDILEKNKKLRARTKAHEEYLLTSKLFCGHCKAMMTGYCGSSASGKKHYYYACKNNVKKLCKKKYAHKLWIEDLVVKKCYEILTDENIEIIARECVKVSMMNKDTSIINLLRKQLKDYEKEINNLMQAVAECPIEQVRQGLYSKLSETIENKKELEAQLAIESNKVGIMLNEEQVIFFLNKLRKGNPNDLHIRRSLISTFVVAVYLYDLPDGNKRITYILSVNGTPTELTEDILNAIENNSVLIPNTLGSQKSRIRTFVQVRFFYCKNLFLNQNF